MCLRFNSVLLAICSLIWLFPPFLRFSSPTHHLADFVLYFLMLLGKKHSPLIRISGDNTLRSPPNLLLFYHLMSNTVDMPFFLSTLIQSLRSLLLHLFMGWLDTGVSV